MKKAEIIKAANKICAPYDLKASIPGTLKSIGVQGDKRTVTRIMVLSGKFPGHEKLEKISNKISNTLPINRVIYEIKKN